MQMDLELKKLVEFVDTVVHQKAGRRLRDVEVWILEGAWDGKTYGEIAEAYSYTSQYLQQDVGPKFWKLLSDAFDEQLSKRNFRTVLERHFLQQSAGVEQTVPTATPSVALRNHQPRCDWGDAIDVSIFYGRRQELATLKDWILGGSTLTAATLHPQSCRVVALLGMGGMGKTTLATKLAESLQNQFDVVIWRSLRNATTVNEVLEDWLQFLGSEVAKQESLDKRLMQLLQHLREQRCLLVLDNLESVLQVGQPSGAYSNGFEGYGQLLRSVADMQHQSCLLITSREKPVGLAQREGAFVRSLQLQGLSEPEIQGIFIEKGCDIQNLQALEEICAHYAGNPLALKIVAAALQQMTGGDINLLLPHLRQGTFAFEDINDLLARQLHRLSSLELQVMNWLAINRKPITLLELESDAVSTTVAQQFPAAVRSLGQRSMIECQGVLISLQPAVMEYITHRFVSDLSAEIIAEQPSLLHDFVLLKAQSEDYIRQAQKRFIVQPLIDRLFSDLGSAQAIVQRCQNILIQTQQTPHRVSYAAGNLLNLLIEMKLDLSGLDFSDLRISQAYLAGTKLQNLNFSRAHFEKTVFTTVLGVALSMAYSPDGTLLAIGNVDNKVRLWQVQRAAEFLTLEGHASWVLSVAFSPDGALLAGGSLDRTVRVWDIVTGQCLYTLEGHAGWVWSVTFSPDGQTLVSGSNDQSIRIWDVATGNCLHTLHHQPSGVWSVAFSPDGDQLVCGHDNHTLELWQTSPWQPIRIMEGHSNEVRSVLFRPDGKTVVSGSCDATVRVWDAASGECLKVLEGHRSLINCIALNPNGKTLASSSSDCTVRLWNLETGHCIKTLQGHAVGVWSVAFDPAGQTLASGSNDSAIKFWNAQGQALRTFQGYCAGIKALSLNSDGVTIASGGDDPTIRIWNAQTGECLKQLHGPLSWLWCLAYGHQGTLLASGGGGDFKILLWNVETGRIIQTLQGHTDLVFTIAFDAGDDVLASSSNDTTVRLWSIETGKCLQVLSHGCRVWSVQFCPDGRSLVSGAEDKLIRHWDIASGACLRTFSGHTGLIVSVALNADGQYAASGGDDTIVKLWDFRTGACLADLKGHQASIRSVEFSADGRLLASGSDDRTLRIWDLRTQQCLHVLQEHGGQVWKVAFTADGLAVVSASQDGMIRFWDIKTGECMLLLSVKRPYDGMNITGVTGITDAQVASLQSLGAVVTG